MDASFIVRVDCLDIPITVLPPSVDANIRSRLAVKLHLCNHRWDKWIVVAECSLNNVIFTKGWRTFLHDNGIEEGDTIVFNHVTVDMFEVIFFDKQGSVKSPPAKGTHSPYAGRMDFMT
ncbi:transcriptional factor B3 family protein [Striga asiatica]|uniref:Transcriptional factor B3 family protein n=1 Tax=Striga asiatica TaxID=4170 RepID=A0A5A7PHV4_STRAF|nr:transcriptional factor B3 family protein [Striga asiatica]GER32370.1 transcriptional factor B3 family protein [Striga asiatica]GER40125.1 transcriptional factor B3 family protein [Striga asiatica]